MPQGTNISNFEQSRSEHGLTPFDNATEFYLHEANPELLSFEEARARREALGAAASTENPANEEKHHDELAVEGIARRTAWLNHARHSHSNRHDEKAA